MGKEATKSPRGSRGSRRDAGQGEKKTVRFRSMDRPLSTMRINKDT